MNWNIFKPFRKEFGSGTHHRITERVPEDASLRQLLHGRKPYVYRVIYETDERAATVRVLHIRGPRRDRMRDR